MGKAIWLITKEKFEEIKNNKKYRIVKSYEVYYIICATCNHVLRKVTFNKAYSNNKYIKIINISEGE